MTQNTSKEELMAEYVRSMCLKAQDHGLAREDCDDVQRVLEALGDPAWAMIVWRCLVDVPHKFRSSHHQSNLCMLHQHDMASVVIRQLTGVPVGEPESQRSRVMIEWASLVAGEREKKLGNLTAREILSSARQVEE